MTTYYHPSSIQVRVGAVLSKIELQIEQQDPDGLNNFVQLLVTYCKPYFRDAPEMLRRLEAIPAYGACKGVPEAFRCDMERVEICLCLLRDKSLYGYSETPVGDSSALYETEEDNPIVEVLN